MDELSTLPILESIRVDDQRQPWAGSASQRSERVPRPRRPKPEEDEEDVPEEERGAEHNVDVSA